MSIGEGVGNSGSFLLNDFRLLKLRVFLLINQGYSRDIFPNPNPNMDAPVFEYTRGQKQAMPQSLFRNVITYHVIQTKIVGYEVRHLRTVKVIVISVYQSFQIVRVTGLSLKPEWTKIGSKMVS